MSMSSNALRTSKIMGEVLKDAFCTPTVTDSWEQYIERNVATYVPTNMETWEQVKPETPWAICEPRSTFERRIKGRSFSED